MYPEKKGGSHKMARPQQNWSLLTHNLEATINFKKKYIKKKKYKKWVGTY